MAIVKACLSQNSVKNTGKECDVAMGATAMLIAVPSTYSFTDTDLEDPVAWLTALLHASKATRAYPLFGHQAPIRTINNNPEADVTVTLDDGTIIFLRYGMFNRTFETTSGGLCYAKALQSFNASGYRIIEIDITGKMLVHKKADGSYTGMIIDFMFSPSPVLADFKTTPYKNRFQYTFNPVEMVTNGEVLEGASELLAFMGLIDVEITEALAATTTILKVDVKTECADTDLLELFPTELPLVANFVVNNKATGAAVVPTAAAIVSGHLHLTGTYVSGQTYIVKGAAPSVWLSNDVDGYDGSELSAEILIP